MPRTGPEPCTRGEEASMARPYSAGDLSRAQSSQICRRPATPGRVRPFKQQRAYLPPMSPAPSLPSLPTAHPLNKPSGWITITHPFHPWHGQRFEIFKCRDITGVRMLGLTDSTGNTHFIPMEWTDRSPTSSDQLLEDPKPILNVRCLLSLARIVAQSLPQPPKN
jgi:hypothetical protein